MKQQYIIGRLFSQVGKPEAQRIATKVDESPNEKPSVQSGSRDLVILQSDLQHFSAQFALDPDAAEAELREVTKIISRAVTGNRGFIERRVGDRTTAQFTRHCPISSESLSDTDPWIRALKAGLDCVRFYHQMIEERYRTKAGAGSTFGTSTDYACSLRLAITGIEHCEVWKTIDLSRDIYSDAPPEMMTLSTPRDRTWVNLHVLANRLCECANFENIKSICRKADRSASYQQGAGDAAFTNLVAKALNIYRRSFLLVDIHELSEVKLKEIMQGLPTAWDVPVLEGRSLQLVPTLLPFPGLHHVPLGRTLPGQPNRILAPKRRLAMAFWGVGLSPIH